MRDQIALNRSTPEGINTAQVGYLPALLGIEWLACSPDRVVGRLQVEQKHLASTGFLHAATVVALADTACGYGCLAALPEGATSFTTAELKANYLGTAREGLVSCEARPAHLGRTTQVWDATVKEDLGGKTIALFRCTQILLYPRSPVRED